jgi:hypothetical protein
LDASGQLTNDPDKAVTWQTIADPVEIEERLLALNIPHLSQDQGTLFTMQQLKEIFGYSGKTPEATKLLEGRISSDAYAGMTRGVTTLLNVLGNKGNLPPIDDNIDIETFSRALGRWSG